MKRHLNTLFVTTDGAAVLCDGETLKVRVEEETKLRLPIHLLSGLVCFGPIYVSPAAMALCAENEVAVSFLSMGGRFLAKVVGPISGNVLLRREQYRRADDAAFSARVSRLLIGAKLLNCRTGLQRSLRDRPDQAGAARLEAGVQRLQALLLRLPGLGPSLDVLRGLEGEAARGYFEVFDDLIVARKELFRWQGRSRRPPLDRVNALLSFLYTLLAHDVRSALEVVGLDPAVGYLHEERPGRPSLALDLMEELRPVLADRLALSLINRQQLGEKDFRQSESGGVYLNDAGRKVVLTAYQTRKQETLKHPFLGEETTYGLLMYVQALLFARFLRGDLEEYPPFVWK